MAIVEKIEGVEQTFGKVGRLAILDAVKEIRRQRQDAFVKAGPSICGEGATVGQVLFALQQYMDSMIIPDQVVRQWLFNYEGAVMLLCLSLRKANSQMSVADAESVVDQMSEDQFESISLQLIDMLFPPRDQAATPAAGDAAE